MHDRRLARRHERRLAQPAVFIMALIALSAGNGWFPSAWRQIHRWHGGNLASCNCAPFQPDHREVRMGPATMFVPLQPAFCTQNRLEPRIRRGVSSYRFFVPYRGRGAR